MAQSPNPPFLTRVMLKNYRSIAGADVELGPLTFLVGLNGSGKSSFLDALRLISDSLAQSLDHALRDRGGINEVRRRSSGHPNHFAIRVDFTLPTGSKGWYAFEIASKAAGAYVVKTEECAVGGHRYKVRMGQLLVTPGDVAPPVSDDRLYLTNAAGLPAFRPVYDALMHMGFYNLNPLEIRKPQTPDKGDILKRDGSNLPSVLERLEKLGPDGPKTRIEEYLARVVEGIEGVEHERIGPLESIKFRQRIEGADKPWGFPAINMSDGTLRALGILIALFQQPERGRIPVVGIEEPEVALHPAAAGVLRDCLREASDRTQVLVTSHSPELLDDPNIPADALLAVVAEGGTTTIGSLDDVGRGVLRDRLYTPGELLRADQLKPSPESRRRGDQLKLFDEEAA